VEGNDTAASQDETVTDDNGNLYSRKDDNRSANSGVAFATEQPSLVTILDSDLKPKKRRTGRILMTQMPESLPTLSSPPTSPHPAIRQSRAHQPNDEGTECSSAEQSPIRSDGDAAQEVDGGSGEWEDTANACCACLDWACEQDDPIVFCDGLCGACVHLSCYGLDAVPEGDFYCESCRVVRRGGKPTCALCFRPGGLMRRSVCKQRWFHPVCVLFTPELTLDDSSRRLNNITELCADRADLVCQLCRKNGGACVQCCVGECLAAFHPYCAYTARQQMLVRIDPHRDQSVCELYCPKHKHRPMHGVGMEICSSRIPVRRAEDAGVKDREAAQKATAKRTEAHGIVQGMEVRKVSRMTSLDGARKTTAVSKAKRYIHAIHRTLQRSFMTEYVLTEMCRMRKSNSMSDARRSPQLQLVAKSSRDRVDHERPATKRRKVNAERFFETEAAVSGR
jgi:hypothetical protein